jgi:hypothetical protein
VSEERKAAKAKSLLETGRDVIAQQQQSGPVLSEGERAAVVVTGDADTKRITGAVDAGKGVEVMGGVEKSKSRGRGWFAGLRWRK